MPHIALQLYTLRNECEKNFEAVLDQVAQMGYEGVEFAGYWGRPAAALRAQLDRLGIVAVSTHVGMDTIREKFPQVLRDAKTLGCKYVTVPAPPSNFAGDEPAWRIFREELKFYHVLLQHSGLALCYHNHAREFEAVEEDFVPFDWFFSKPHGFLCQLDVYWASFAGCDPSQQLRQLVGRCPLIHVKDMSKDETRRDEIPGDGCLPWRDILGAALEAQTEWLIVEQDNPRENAMLAVQRGLHFVKRCLREIASQRPTTQ
ncbi:MAG: sugar phosphate isomerase/epimerase [Candidatus Hydrogenedentota bacterium]|jgi:sugar phosphate isomerase/epimerase|nr:MAG: sugar phosphate isomerase/epimerase [Candidatus Hydrogenedentota bacterium]GIX44221.1 MAG: sugar phosphate isomerase [Candidatus Sumerlaea sp.]